MDGIINNRGTARKHDFPGSADEWRGKSNARKLLLCLFVVHIAATLFFLSPGDILNDKPIVTLDHSFHYYQAWRAKDVLLTTGQLTAYDPYFMAGFPSAIFDLDVKGAELFCALFPEGQLARGLKLFILICYLSMVFTVYGGARLLGFDRREALLGVGVLLVFWHWGRPYASHFRYAGMFEFVFVSHLSILVVGLFRHFLRADRRLWFFVFGSALFLVHPTAVVVVTVPFICLIIVERKRLTQKKAMVFFVWCGTVVAVNLIWVLPMLANMTAKASSKQFFQTGGVRDLASVLFHPGCLPALVLLVLAALGAWCVIRTKRTAGAAVMIPSVLFLLTISTYGVYLPGIQHLEPGRFLLTALFFAAPLAGAGAAFVIAGVTRRSFVHSESSGAGGGSRSGSLKPLSMTPRTSLRSPMGPSAARTDRIGHGILSVAISAGCYNSDAPEDMSQGQYAVSKQDCRLASTRGAIERGVFAILLIAPIVLSFLSARTGYQHRVTTSFTPEVQTLIEVLVDETDPSGRLMIEDGPAALYGEAHMPGILPVYTGVEQIGGPSPYTFLKHHFATFQRDLTFGKPLAEMSPVLFWRYIELYNVRWIVTASPFTRGYISGAAAETGAAPPAWEVRDGRAAEITWASPRYALWRVNRPAAFAAPDGEPAVVGFNHLEIVVGPGDGAVLLPYHWDSGMKTASPATLSPLLQLGDPVPFALVEPNGLSLIVIKH